MKMLVTILAGVTTLAANALMPEDVDKFTPEKIKEPVVYSNKFEPGENGDIRLRPGYSINPAAGVGSSGALVFERTDANQYQLTTLYVPQLKDQWYTLKFSVRCEHAKNVKGNPYDPGIVCVEFTSPADNRFLGGRYAKIPVPGKDWQDIQYRFQASSKQKTGIVFYLRKGWIGKIVIDNVTVSPAVTPLSAVLNWPSNYAVHGKSSGYVFKLDPGVAPRCKALLTVTNGKECRRSIEVADAAGFIKGTLKNLVPGKLQLRLQLLDEKKRTVLHSQEYNLNVYPERAVPGNSARLDRSGRLFVAGKPFMPLGVFTYHVSPSDLKRIADAGFNCIMDYKSLYLKSVPPADNPVASIRRVLDEANKNGLKFIFSLKDQLPGQDARKELAGTAGAMNVVERIVTELKDHPALLAWYLCDEEPRENVPAIVKMREIVSRIDPWHPTWALTCYYHTLPYYAVSGDVVGIDLYPIEHNKPHSSIEAIAPAMTQGTSAGLPVWAVPQIFNWGVYAHKNNPQAFAAGRAPTQDEMTAMALLYAICGARGFVFYSYFDLYDRAEKLSPGSREKEWSKVCNLAKTMKSLEPYIMSNRATPRVQLENRRNVRIRSFADESGRVAVLAVGTDRNNSATFSVPGCDNLKSKFGRTRHLGGDRYEFASSEVAGDILIQELKPQK